jgi:hypothetical protein
MRNLGMHDEHSWSPTDVIHYDQQALAALAPAILEAFIRKRQEDPIKRANEELEQRVRERTEQLRALSGELTSAEQRERKLIHKGKSLPDIANEF